MKKGLYLLIIVGLLLIGCNDVTSGEKSVDLELFDNAGIKAKIEKKNFKPEFPTEIPFTVEDTVVSSDPSNDTHSTVEFFGEGNHLSLSIFKGDNLTQGAEYEEVEIGNIQGKYRENKAGTKLLYWQEDGISYSLGYLSKQSKEKVTKEQLIAVAELFE
ncbi:DUF4367 domain-containing protein [Virgibacillus kekensis]|uniref:DUF4367 domain-containing protein n=1 Tax=Virgibacillus kekensis TaxID=202261 RepID=A0ABV9DD62_9BACI